ncbi:uncharacterized protein LOC107364175 isoform X2 [Tetranychus urticae]|uniref:uncharacterized protein LOC107364175 isoform X2 n=1 Tax=Tetranychus urticae TaxID=32264 RepID=UPI00077C034E|nr:uncharacterized protein LOC107364175 isoform X2 [Tetranychus urticae]
MEIDQIISAIQSSLDSPTLDTDYTSLCNILAVQPLHQPLCSNQSLALLNAFCSDEDTVKSYLIDGDQNNGQFLDSSMKTYDNYTENLLNFNDQSHGRWTIENLTSAQASISSCMNNDSLAVKSPLWPKINDEKFNLKSNFILLIERGYKLILSLNTDNSEVEEPWNPDVSQKILAVSFSSLSLRSEYLSDDTVLNGFESLLMDEAYAAFKGQRCLHLFTDLSNRSLAKAIPDWLISICNEIKSFRKIETNDKITLLSSNYNHLNLMEGIFSYDATIDGWGFSGFKYDRRDTFLFNKFLHDEMVKVIETFPDRFRNDINVIILMYLIIIFNADIIGLKHPEIIRHEQFSYIHLLRRYLRTVCESDCEASDNHYRLMAKIEQLRLLSEQTQNIFATLLKEPFVESVTRAVIGEYIHQFYLQDESIILGCTI